MSKATSGFIDIGQQQSRHDGIWTRPVGQIKSTLVLAHGAGAPMDSEFMQAMAERLAQRSVAVYRFEFAYMAARRIDGKKRPPNAQAQLLEQWREAYAWVREQVQGPVAIGGKSMGGRMASLLADELGASALICLGYPFYAVGKPEKPRVAHLADFQTPTLIVQGTRDALGNQTVVAQYALSPVISLYWLESGDHDFKPLKASGLTQMQHIEAAAQAVAEFLSTSK